MKSLKEQFAEIGIGKKRGAVHEWQDVAARMAKELGFKPGKNWFKLFKVAYEKKKAGLLERAFTFTVDAKHPNPEKLFYWKYWDLFKKGR